MKTRQKMDRKTIMMNILRTVLIMVIATVAALCFFELSKNATNVAIIYILAVMLVARSTTGYVPGIIASLIGVGCVNYVFTYPFMKLNFTMDGYPITFVGMMVISTMTSALMTSLIQKNAILNEREKMLMDAEKETMRANLLRAVSHDLRTPLTSIIGLAETYLAGKEQLTEAEKSDMVTNIREDANWLLHMVENLLSVTRIRVGATKLTTTLEPLEEVVSEALQRFRKRLPETKVQVRIPDEFLMVPMDAVLIEQVIVNLLENAVYHSQSEEPIQLLAQVQGNHVVLQVRDLGKGIDPERLPFIFDGAGTDCNESSDSHKGMGIGLSICKTIIAAHNGTIDAVNQDQGVAFIFTLPLENEEGNHA